MMMTDHDPFGAAALDKLNGRADRILVERDYGYLDEDRMDGLYFSKYRRFPECEKRALAHVTGKVLDIGIGPGRVALHLQSEGFEVTGIDISDKVLQVARKRGAKDAQKMSACDLRFPKNSFSTAVAFGNNFGICGWPTAVASMLKKLADIVSDDGVFLAESLDPLNTTEKAHLKYHERNRSLGRPPGKVRLRLRYKKIVGDWLDLLLCTPSEMKALAERGGWRVQCMYYYPEDSPVYVGVLRKR